MTFHSSISSASLSSMIANGERATSACCTSMGGKATCAFIGCQFNAAIPSVTIAIMDGPPRKKMRGEGEHPSKNLDFLFRAFLGIRVHIRNVGYVQVTSSLSGWKWRSLSAPVARRAAARSTRRAWFDAHRRPEGNGHAIEARRHSRLPNRLRDPEE